MGSTISVSWSTDFIVSVWDEEGFEFVPGRVLIDERNILLVHVPGECRAELPVTILANTVYKLEIELSDDFDFDVDDGLS